MTNSDKNLYCRGCKHLSYKDPSGLKYKHPKNVTYLYDPLKRKAGYCVVYHSIEEDLEYCCYYENRSFIQRVLDYFKR